MAQSISSLRLRATCLGLSEAHQSPTRDPGSSLTEVMRAVPAAGEGGAAEKGGAHSTGACSGQMQAVHGVEASWPAVLASA